jgi:DNA-binding transcriptional MocR family regulator
VNAGGTAERVYAALKNRLLSGEFKPGERLDPSILCGGLSSSVTPVRDVLNVLTGEGLVEALPGQGFHRPHITAPDLQDLYDWNEHVVNLTIRNWPKRTQIEGASFQAPAPVPDQTGSLFLAIARCSPNHEHRRAIERLNDRLSSIRECESVAISETGAELAEMIVAFDARSTHDLARLVTGYHRRRRRAASEIVRAAYRY